ncbi:MAG: EthD domain-containing protein [Halioglobus sp.]
MRADLTLVHGLYCADNSSVPASKARCDAIAELKEAIGICDYEWIDGQNKKLANLALRLARGTAPPVAAVEIIGLNESAVRASLADKSGRALWKNSLACTPYGLDPQRSFLLIGQPRLQLEGPATGQRLLWFGRGLTELTEQEFITHYTEHHGPLVAGYAESLGLRRYRQVPKEHQWLDGELRELGLGQAESPSVFAELFMGMPPINLRSLAKRRLASREIATDEKCHISFADSMLLLA